MGKKRVFYLDFIRAISVISIVIFHFNCSLSAHGTYIGKVPVIFYSYRNGNLGQMGVSLFFIISGASLMYTYKDSCNLKEYVAKRCKAIYPMFYIAYIAVAIYYFYRYKSLNPFVVDRERWSFIFTILGIDGVVSPIIPNFYILGEWFLGCILFMYLLFPLLRKLVISVRPYLLIIICIILFCTTVSLYNTNYPIEYFVFIRIYEMLFGMIFIYYIDKFNIKLTLISLVAIIIWFSVDIPIPQIYKTVLMGFFLFVLLGYIGQNIKCSNKFKKIIIIVSSYSYPIYLIHHVAMEQVCSHFENANFGIIEAYFVLICVIIVIALLAYLLKKFNGLLTQFLSK